MTAIAYRDGVLAADSLIGAGDQIFGTDRKITRRSDGALMAAAGSSDLCYLFSVAFLNNQERDFECPCKERGAFQALVVYPDGTCWEHTVYGHHPAEKAPFTAMGSADVFLMGAMAAGASAEAAVALAIEWRKDIGGPPLVERLEPR